MLISVTITACLGGVVYAALLPVEGSSNLIDNGLEDSDSETSSCADVEFLFARGSGAQREKSGMWLQFRDESASVMRKIGKSYRLTDLEYPAVSVTDPFTNAIGAYVSAGEYYAFGRSVDAGVENARAYYYSIAAQCPDSQWVVAGYSQGAIVAAEAVRSFRSSKVVYVALFADPQLSLPEGRGLFPDACKGKNLSSYRTYAPVCRTHTGRLSARNPYVYGDLGGKYSLWCNKNDYICGSSANPLNNSGHTDYEKHMTQYASILRKRLISSVAQNKSSVLLASLTAEPDVVAFLPLEQYYVESGEEVVLDASQSFSENTALIDYI